MTSTEHDLSIVSEIINRQIDKEMEEVVAALGHAPPPVVFLRVEGQFYPEWYEAAVEGESFVIYQKEEGADWWLASDTGNGVDKANGTRIGNYASRQAAQDEFNRFLGRGRD